jgi:hypothetical protein
MFPATSAFYRIMISALVVSVQWSASALAEGGLADHGIVQSQAAVTVNATGDGYALSSTVGGAAEAGNLSSTVTVWGATTIKTTVLGDVSVDNTSATATMVKGQNTLSVGQAVTEAAITVNGKTYVVAKEVATALARSTQYGSSTAVSVDGAFSGSGVGTTGSYIAASRGSR